MLDELKKKKKSHLEEGERNLGAETERQEEAS